MMGSGKSTVGRRVATRTGRRFVDLDAEIEAAAGCSIAEIFERDGEASFRRRESAALGELLAPDDPPRLIAAGGGAVLAAGNRRVMRARASVVWLKVAPDILGARLGSGEGRPLLADDPDATLRRLVEERECLYRDAADVVLETRLESVDDVASLVIERLVGRE
jgi:shikimate kinase